VVQAPLTLGVAQLEKMQLVPGAQFFSPEQPATHAAEAPLQTKLPQPFPSAPPGASVQVPWAFGKSQRSQPLLHAVLQQKPSAQ